MKEKTIMNVYNIHIRKINRIQVLKCGKGPERLDHTCQPKTWHAIVLMDAIRRQHSRSAKRDSLFLPRIAEAKVTALGPPGHTQRAT